MLPNRSFLRIWSHLLKKSLMENLILKLLENIEGCIDYRSNFEIALGI